MNSHQWKALIVGAVNNPDEDQLDSLAAHLAECELAKGILRARGYGKSGQSIDVMVREVPHVRD